MDLSVDLGFPDLQAALLGAGVNIDTLTLADFDRIEVQFRSKPPLQQDRL